MKLIDAYTQAINEDEDYPEVNEFSTNVDLKTQVVEEITEALKQFLAAKEEGQLPVEMLKPIFACVSFWFIVGIRVGKILRDAELAN
jgi:hypothetical protein